MASDGTWDLDVCWGDPKAPSNHLFHLSVPWPPEDEHIFLVAFPRRIPSGNLLRSYWKWPFLMGKSTISMAIFNSYVKLPEGKACVLDVQRRCFLIAEMTWNKKETGLRWTTLSPNLCPSKNIIYKLYIYTQGIYMLNDSYPSIYIYIIYIIYCIL